MAIAETFLDGNTIRVALVGKPSGTGLVKVQAITSEGALEGKIFVRHVDRLNPVDDEAREMLGEESLKMLRSRFFLRWFYVEQKLIDEQRQWSAWLARTSRLGFIFGKCIDRKIPVETAGANYDEACRLVQQRLEVVEARLSRVRKMKSPPEQPPTHECACGLVTTYADEVRSAGSPPPVPPQPCGKGHTQHLCGICGAAWGNFPEVPPDRVFADEDDQGSRAEKRLP